MTTLILAGEVIVAASDAVQQTPGGWVTPDAVYPAAAGITGVATVASLPADFRTDRYIWRGGALVRLPDPPPLPAPPPALTARQLRLGLLSLGVTGAQVEAIIAALPDATAREAARIEWEYSSVYERAHPLIATVAAQLGLAEADIDAAWLAAASL